MTLVGEEWAKPGVQFEYAGLAPECESCKLRKVCHDLEPGMRYRITATRDVHHDCPAGFFEGGLRVASVEPVPIPATIPLSARRGTATTHSFEECGAACLYKKFCKPAGVPNGTKCRIVEVGEPVTCYVGRELLFAKLVPEKR